PTSDLRRTETQRHFPFGSFSSSPYVTTLADRAARRFALAATCSRYRLITTSALRPATRLEHASSAASTFSSTIRNDSFRASSPPLAIFMMRRLMTWLASRPSSATARNGLNVVFSAPREVAGGAVLGLTKLRGYFSRSRRYKSRTTCFLQPATQVVAAHDGEI